MYQRKGPRALCGPESQPLLNPGTLRNSAWVSDQTGHGWWRFPEKGEGAGGGCSRLCKYRNFPGTCAV